MKDVGVKRAYENLANAIVLSAIRDYKRALIRLKRNPNSESAARAVAEGERFLYSPWFEVLTDLHPDYLKKKLNELIEERY